MPSLREISIPERVASSFVPGDEQQRALAQPESNMKRSILSRIVVDPVNLVNPEILSQDLHDFHD